MSFQPSTTARIGGALRRLAAAAALAIAAWGAAGSGAQAVEPLPQPRGDVLLIVSGKIGAANVGETAMFDREMLENLPIRSFTTSTNWTEGEVRFSGPSLRGLIERLGITAGRLRATAINDYEILLPVSDAVDPGPILALEMNGAAMSVRDKGPLWIVYPYDSNPAWRSEEVFARSIWQLERIEAVD